MANNNNNRNTYTTQIPTGTVNKVQLMSPQSVKIQWPNLSGNNLPNAQAQPAFWRRIFGVFLLTLILPILSCAIMGCGPYMTHVYGKSGTVFTAPTICAALVQCMNSNETSCFYDKTLLTTATGTEETGGCKEVKK
jgi:hypothetical protein